MKRITLLVVTLITLITCGCAATTGSVTPEPPAAPIPVLTNTPGAIPVDAMGPMDPTDPACGVWKGKWAGYGQPITVVVTKTSIAYGVEAFKDAWGTKVSPGYMVFDPAPLPTALQWKRPNGSRVFKVMLEAPKDGVIEGKWETADGGWDTATLRRQ